MKIGQFGYTFSGNPYQSRSGGSPLGLLSFFRVSLAMAATGLGLLLLPMAGPVAADEEPNDQFEAREAIAPDQSVDPVVIEGELAQRFNPDEFDHSFSGNLEPGQAESFEIEDLTPSDSFYAWVTNGESGPDTVLGLFSQDSLLIAADDDSSPMGNGTASALSGTVNPDGTVHMAVTGFPDYEFTALKDSGSMIHQERGAYEVRVRMGGDVPLGDVDYYTFTGLTPGSEFVVEVTEASFDSILGWLDDNGQVIYVDDDGAQELRSRLRGYVPLSGNVSIALSAFGDASFLGQHIASGTYTLTLTQP